LSRTTEILSVGQKGDGNNAKGRQWGHPSVIIGHCGVAMEFAFSILVLLGYPTDKGHPTDKGC